MYPLEFPIVSPQQIQLDRAGFRIPDEFPMIQTGDGNGHRRTSGSLNLSPFHGELQNP